MMHKTFNLKAVNPMRTWVLLDASEAPLGRIATIAATRLTGKYKPTYTPHMDDGDCVIIINAAKTVVTGSKASDKMYYHHSGFPGGIKAKNFTQALEKDAAKVVVDAIRGMLPKNKLMSARLQRLKVYTTEQHMHEAQQPTKIGVTHE
jgi:large subunit ribosomal protein L13